MLVGLADVTRPPGGGSEAPYGSPDRAELTQRLATLTALATVMARRRIGSPFGDARAEQD